VDPQDTEREAAPQAIGRRARTSATGRPASPYLGRRTRVSDRRRSRGRVGPPSGRGVPGAIGLSFADTTTRAARTSSTAHPWRRGLIVLAALARAARRQRWTGRRIQRDPPRVARRPADPVSTIWRWLLGRSTSSCSGWRTSGHGRGHGLPLSGRHRVDGRPPRSARRPALGRARSTLGLLASSRLALLPGSSSWPGWQSCCSDGLKPQPPGVS